MEEDSAHYGQHHFMGWAGQSEKSELKASSIVDLFLPALDRGCDVTGHLSSRLDFMQ